MMKLEIFVRTVRYDMRYGIRYTFGMAKMVTRNRSKIFLMLGIVINNLS